jgi:hypothetical protein
MAQVEDPANLALWDNPAYQLGVGQQARERSLGLKACQWRADTEVDAVAEGQVAARLRTAQAC